MDLKIRSNGTKVTDGMREFIDRRMEKLDRLAEHVVDAHLELRTMETRTGNEITTAQLTLRTGKHVIRAEERDAEPAKAIDAAIDKLISQVRKFNSKRITRKRKGVSPDQLADSATVDLAIDEAFSQADVSTADEDGAEEFVVRTKKFAMKPMLVNEAIDQMELVGHSFFLFLNADVDQLNVLYRREDGSYGLLQPS